MRAGRFRKRRGESQSFLFRDADQESKTRMRNNALRTGPRQAVEQAKKEKVAEDRWVSQLIPLLPIEIAEIVAKEPLEKSDDYPHIKNLLLARFQLTPIALRDRFESHQRRPGAMWADSVFELRSYLDNWLAGMKVDDFAALKELLVTEQIKKRAPSELVDHFLDSIGFPREIQSDLGTSFTSEFTTTFFNKFGIKVTRSSVSHPQSNAVEQGHRTIKRVIKALCVESGEHWEGGLPLALFSLRTVAHESTGFSPTELVMGKNLRTPQTLVYEEWMEEGKTSQSVGEYILQLNNRLKRCEDIAITRMKECQLKRKMWYDRDAIERKFVEGDLVMVLATSKQNKLEVNWIGPGKILSRISDTKYVIDLPGRRDRSTNYHVNLLKPFRRRPELVSLVVEEVSDDIEEDAEIPYPDKQCTKFDYHESQLQLKLSPSQIDELKQVITKNKDMFSPDPGTTHLMRMDIEPISDKHIKTKPYRMSPRQINILREEIKLESPNKDPRPCVDYRRLNEITRAEFFPLPNMEEVVEKVSTTPYVTVMDYSKGYFQIPLTPRAQRCAAFVTPFGTYIPNKMMFRVERSRKKHIDIVLGRLRKAGLKVKPSKCNFAQEEVLFLGHRIGSGSRSPSDLKIKAIADFPQPTTKTHVRSFLGLVGYYSHYIPNYSTIASPLTDALKGKIKKEKITWDERCGKAFEELKAKLVSQPILFAPDFVTDFILQTDASEVGAGVVLSQRIEGEEHPIVFLSKKFSKAERNYNTVKRELAATIFSLKRLKHYLDGQKFIIETDHNPLRYLNKMGSTNPRTILDRVLGARAAGVHYRLISVWTLVPVRLGKQLSDHSTVDEMSSEAADCRLTYTMANCPQRRRENEKKRKESSEKTRAGRFRKRRGESQGFLFRDADQESKTRMRNNALRTGPRQAVE
ncbi:retrovirus-related Pol polyprotein from transposon 297 [Trichonephila clavipes]|nr:retrovirus-related Pol polyprotein from transposon 297 [Trichonephila clavipes]